MVMERKEMNILIKPHDTEAEEVLWYVFVTEKNPMMTDTFRSFFSQGRVSISTKL